MYSRDLYSAARPSRRNGLITILLRVCQRQRRLLWESLRQSLSVPPFTGGFMNFFTLTFRALGTHCHDLGHDRRMTSYLKQSVHNCTVNFSDVGTAHGSRTVSLHQLSPCTLSNAMNCIVQTINEYEQFRYHITVTSISGALCTLQTERQNIHKLYIKENTNSAAKNIYSIL